MRYPLVDEGMCLLLEEGWMHNPVRMITASFLVKDLHIDWTRGARHFIDHLIDGDVASNPAPILDHSDERADSLARYRRARSQRDFVGTAPCSWR